MSPIKSLDATSNEELVTIEDHVKSSEILKNINPAIRFDYELNDKATTAKLLKAARQMPIAGYFNDVKGEKTCKVGEYAIKRQES